MTVLSADRQAQHQSILLAILGHVADAGPDGIARTADAHRLSVDADLARVVRVEPEDGAGHLRAASTDQAGQAEDLAGADLEADVLEDAGARVAADLEDDVADGHRALGEQVLDLAADHHAHDLAGVQLRDGP